MSFMQSEYNEFVMLGNNLLATCLVGL